MGRGLQPVGARFSNLILGKLSSEFKLHGMSIFHEIQMAVSRVLREATVKCLNTLIAYTYCACWYDLDPIQGQGHGASKCPKIAENYTFLGLSPPPFWRRAQNWRLIMIVQDLSTACRSPIFEFYFKKAITWIQTSRNVDITRISNGHIGLSVLLEATLAWSGKLVVIYVLRILMWPWPDPRSRSRSLAFWSYENCTFLRLPPPLFSHGAHNWWVITIVWDIVYSFSEPDFGISPQLWDWKMRDPWDT